MAEEVVTDYPPDDNAPLIGVTEPSSSGKQSEGVMTPNLFIVFVPVSFFAVLVVSFWLTEDGDRGIDLKAIFSCELAILLVSIIAIIVFVLIDIKGKFHWRPRHPSLRELQPLQNYEGASWLAKMPVREMAYGLLCTGSILLIIFHTMSLLYESLPDARVVDCIEVAGHVFTLVFCLLQTLFVINYRKCVLRNKLLRYLVALVIASDCCICIKYVFFFVRLIHVKDPADFPFFPIPRSHTRKPGILTDITTQGETYLFFCIVEYALFSVVYLCKLWIRTSFESKRPSIQYESINSQSDEQRMTTSTGLMQKARHYFWATLRVVSYHSFYFSAFLCLTIVGINLGLSIIGTSHKKADGGYSSKAAKTYAEKVAIPLETCIAYISSVVAFTGYIMSKEEKSSHHVKKADKRVLLLTAFAFMILAMMETIESGLEVANDSDKDVGVLVTYCLFTFFQYVFLYCQTQTIIKVSEMQVVSPITFHQLVIRGISVYLGLYSFERWIEASFLTPIDLIQTNHLNNGFGVSNWWAILSTLYPFVSFYYLWCAVLCFEMLVRFPKD